MMDASIKTMHLNLVRLSGNDVGTELRTKRNKQQKHTHTQDGS